MIDLRSRRLGAQSELGEGELSEQTHGLLLQVVGQTRPDSGEGNGCLGQRWMTTHGGPSRKHRYKGVWGHPSPQTRAKNADLSAGRWRKPSLPTEIIEKLGHLPQPLEVEQVSPRVRRRGHRVCSVVGGAERHGGVAAVG
jgi:hypothetical protein